MTSTIFAAFEDSAHAERAAGALLDHGLDESQLSLVAHEDYHKTREEGMMSTGVLPGGADTPIGNMQIEAQENEGGMISRAAPESNPVLDRPEISAKTGISTTTSADAGAGAVKGAAVGLSVGAFALVASLLIPGIGLVMGGGALALALTGMVATTGAGALAGGVLGYLKDQGVPEEAITVYRETLERGGSILAVAAPAQFNRANLQAILAKYGAINVEMYGAVKSV